MDIQAGLMGYDRAATMFSPEGRLLQVEYAEKTVRLGALSIGMIYNDGVVIVSDKRIKDELVEGGSVFKIYNVDDHIIASAAGILSDARVLIERAQLIAQQHRVTYDEAIDVETVVKEIASYKQAFTQYGGARPFGVEIMFAGVDTNKSKKLFVTDVTGNYVAYRATAIGEHDAKVKELLRKEYKDSLSLDDSIKLSLRIIKKVMGAEFNINRIEVVYVKDMKTHRLETSKIKQYM